MNYFRAFTSFWIDHWLPQRALLTVLCLTLIGSCLATRSLAQNDDAFGDGAADPIRLFEKGQSAHARNDFEKALEFYDQAIKVKPDFPEAEFQRGNALTSLSRFAEAETAFRKAIELKKNWSLPLSALGVLLVKLGRDAEAEPVFRKALSIDANDNVALRMLSELRLRSGNTREALELARKAIATKDSSSSAHIVLAIAERANGNRAIAKSTLDDVLANEPQNLAALMERADLLTDEKNYEAAIADLKAAEKLKPADKTILARMAFVYQEAGRLDEAQAVAKAAGLEAQKTNDGKIHVIGTAEEIAAANSEDPKASRNALERLLEKNPRNASLMARLGASYRTEDPARSLEFYRRAAEIEPNSPDYALGYAAALVQARRFAAAADSLRQILKANPDNYAAHANLATALYELKEYAQAVPEYEWLIASKPDVVVAYYFIATAHDYLGEYPEALSSYETFLSRADAKTNQLEIDKVKLRLPTLRRQIQLGEGVKKKP